MRKIDEVYIMNYNDDDELERLRARNRRGTRRPDQGPEGRYRLPGMENRTAAAIMMRNTTTTRNSDRKNMGAKLTAAGKTDGTARARTALVTGTVMVFWAGRIMGTATGSGTVS